MVESAEEALVNHKPLLVEKSVVNGTATLRRPEEWAPPDGGTRAWLVMLGSFFCNGILFGVINSYSVLYGEFHDNFKNKGSTNPSGDAALAGSLAIGTTFLVSAVSGVLTDYIGLRRTTFLGGLIASGGMLLASFCVENKIGIYITFGFMYGLGGALAYTPSLAVLGHYFKKYLGVVNGIVTAGSSVFTVVMPYIMAALLKEFKLAWTLRFLALIASFIMLAAFLFKPLKQDAPLQSIRFRKVCNTSLLLNKKYVIWTVVIAISLFGYFVPYTYIKDFVTLNFGKDADGKIPVMCIGITSGLGRLLFGYIADFPKVNRILLQQIAFLIIGILTMLLPATAGSFPWLIVITLAMGLFDGCFISLLGPIAFDICGQEGATQAIGFLLGTCSIPLTLGPYIAGIIFDHQQSYTIPLILAGIPPTIGSVAMFLTRCVKTRRLKENEPLKNGTLEKHSKGRLLVKSAISTVVKLDKNRNDKNKRCYSYSVL